MTRPLCPPKGTPVWRPLPLGNNYQSEWDEVRAAEAPAPLGPLGAFMIGSVTVLTVVAISSASMGLFDPAPQPLVVGVDILADGSRIYLPPPSPSPPPPV